MAVSSKGHNEEASGRPVDKINLVDMLENHSKTGQKLDNEQPFKKTFLGGMKPQAAVAPL
jgi:hypothetical protein